MRLSPALLLAALAGAASAQAPVPVVLPDTLVYAEPDAVVGAAVSVPVRVGADVTGRGIRSADVVVRFDPAVFDVTAVTVSGIVPSGCTRVTNVRDADDGLREAVALIACSSSTPFAGGPGPLVTLSGTLAGPGRTALALVDETPFNEGGVAAEVTDGSLRVVTDPDPQVEEVGAVTVEEDGTALVELALSDQDTPLDGLTVTAAASDPGLVAVAVGPCENDAAGCRALALTPARDASGSTAITVTVTDGDDRSDDATTSFALTVTPVNDAPVVAAALADRETTTEAAPAEIDLAAVFADVDDASLAYAAVSDAPGVATVSVAGSALTVTPIAPGTATVTVTATDAAGAEAVDSFVLTVRGGVSGEPGAPAPFAVRGVYPNPSAGAARIALDLPSAAEVRVEVFDAVGRRVLRSAGRLGAGAGGTLALDAGALPAGVYAVRVVAALPGGEDVAVTRMTVAE